MTTATNPVISTARALAAASAEYTAAQDADYEARRELAGPTGLLHQVTPPAAVLERLIAAQDARREARLAFEAALRAAGMTLIESLGIEAEDVLEGVLDGPIDPVPACGECGTILARPED